MSGMGRKRHSWDPALSTREPDGTLTSRCRHCHLEQREGWYEHDGQVLHVDQWRTASGTTGGWRSPGHAERMRVLQVTPCANPELARTLLKIQRAAYALEATLIDDDRIPALHEDVEDLRSAPLLWLAAYIDGRLVGALAWSENDEELDIDRLVVAPDMHRRGVGSALVREVLQRAGKRRAVASTGRDNSPAKAMYEQLGFTRTEDEEVIPGLWVTRYSRTAG